MEIDSLCSLIHLNIFSILSSNIVLNLESEAYTHSIQTAELDFSKSNNIDVIQEVKWH